MRKLQQLIGVRELPVTFLETGVSFDASDYVTDLPGREVDIEPVVNLIEEGMRRHPDKPEESDAWLAPRVHHVLRLSRREAARRGAWAWLAVVALPGYVRWRFPGNKGATDIDRFLGREDKNAIGRLWWGAELMRNGGEYGPVAIGFSMQDVPNTWMRLDAFHSRALVQAAIVRLSSYNGGRPATSDQVNAVAKAVNTAARTVLLDAVTADLPLDSIANETWLAGADDVDETSVYDSDPDGPPEDPVPADHIGLMATFMDDVVSRMPAHRPRVGPEQQQDPG